MSNHETPLPPRAAASEVVGVSPATFWRMVASGRLPAPFYPSPRAPRWLASELRAAMEATRAKPREAMAERRAAKLAEIHGRAA